MKGVTCEHSENLPNQSQTMSCKSTRTGPGASIRARLLNDSLPTWTNCIPGLTRKQRPQSAHSFCAHSRKRRSGSKKCTPNAFLKSPRLLKSGGCSCNSCNADLVGECN